MTIKTKKDYDTLQAELAAIEAATGLYLADQSIDPPRPSRASFEDSYAGHSAYLAADEAWWNHQYNADWWDILYYAAAMAAGQRASDAGHDINALIGRVIY